LLSSRNPTINQYSSLIDITQNKNVPLFDRSITTNFQKEGNQILIEEGKFKINLIQSKDDDYLDEIPDENGKNDHEIKRSLTNCINSLSPNFDPNNKSKNFKSIESPGLLPSVKSLSSMDGFSASKDKLFNSIHFNGPKKHQ